MDRALIFNLGAADEIPLGQGKCFVIKGEEVAVFRLRSGKVLAMQNKCPHRQGPLSEGIVDEGKVICPLHGHKFDLVSGRGAEKSECVQTFKTFEQQGQITLEFPCDLINKESSKEYLVG